MSLVPIWRSGLGMVEGSFLSSPTIFTLNLRSPDPVPPAIQSILPRAVPVHHLGLYREPLTLEPVEYYNNLPDPASHPPSGLAIIVDPVIATGGTCAAAIQTLKDWGARRIVVVSILGAKDGVSRAAEEWGDGTEIWLAGVDGEISDGGMLKPGLGDIGDRLFLTMGK